VSGTDGHLNAKYDVLYEVDDEAYEVDHLIQDYQCESNIIFFVNVSLRTHRDITWLGIVDTK
jgi:hypothetical protein